MMRMEITERPQTMLNMFNYKMQEATNMEMEGHIVEGEFRKGLSDPSRYAAQWEKKSGMRKVIGKKAIVDEFMKRIQQLHDDKHYK